MELKEYIKGVILEISSAILEAQNELADKDVVVNPTKEQTKILSNGFRGVQNISFEVFTNLEKKDGNKTGIGVITGVFSLGGSLSGEENNKTGTSIKFDIPIALPSFRYNEKGEIVQAKKL